MGIQFPLDKDNLLQGKEGALGLPVVMPEQGLFPFLKNFVVIEKNRPTSPVVLGEDLRLKHHLPR